MGSDKILYFIDENKIGQQSIKIIILIIINPKICNRNCPNKKYIDTN